MHSGITTGIGDKGDTRTLSGDTFPKSHVVIEAGGALDELRAHTALLRLEMQGAPDDYSDSTDVLYWLLHIYFLLGAACSDPDNARPECHIRNITTNDLARLGKAQRMLEDEVNLERCFVCSGANTLAAQADLLCAVARRFERRLVQLKKTKSAFGYDELFAFANRLSDYFYMLARYLDGPEHISVDYGVLNED